MARTSTFTRFIYVYLVFLLAGLGAIVRIILIQVNKDRVTLDDIYKEQVLEPSRGSILSYDGRPLAVSIPVYDLHWDSKAMPDSVLMPKIDSLSRCLSAMFRNKSARAYRNELLNARKTGKRYLKIGNRKVDFGELAEIRRFPVFRLGQFRRWRRNRHRVYLRLQAARRERHTDRTPHSRRPVDTGQRSSCPAGRGRIRYQDNHRRAHTGGGRDRAEGAVGQERRV